MEKKSILIKVASILLNSTDEDNPLTIQDLTAEIEDSFNQAINRKTVAAAISTWKDSGVLDIERDGKRGYYIDERLFTINEAKLLLEPILRNKKLDEQTKKTICRKIRDTFSQKQSRELERFISIIMSGLGERMGKIIDVLEKARSSAKMSGKRIGEESYVLLTLSDKTSEYLKPSPYVNLPMLDHNIPSVYGTTPSGDNRIIHLRDIVSIRCASEDEIQNTEAPTLSMVTQNVPSYQGPFLLYTIDVDGLPYYSPSEQIARNRTILHFIGDIFMDYIYAGIEDTDLHNAFYAYFDAVKTAQRNGPINKEQIRYWFELFIEFLECYQRLFKLTNPQGHLSILSKSRILIFLSFQLITLEKNNGNMNEIQRVLELMTYFSNGVTSVIFEHVKKHLLMGEQLSADLYPTITESNAWMYPISKSEYSRLVEEAIKTENKDLALTLMEAYAYAPIGPDDNYDDFKKLVEHFGPIFERDDGTYYYRGLKTILQYLCRFIGVSEEYYGLDAWEKALKRIDERRKLTPWLFQYHSQY